MTSKMLDSTISTLLQDKSAVEYVDSQKNPIATIQIEPKNLDSVTTLFDFNAEHNGVQCIESLDPKDRGTERQYWFSVKFLYEAFEVTDKTIRNKLERLEKLGEISNCNFLQLLLPDTCKPSTLYDLTVMNKLAMTLDSADLAESGNARITLISESGLYRILAKCNLPKKENEAMDSTSNRLKWSSRMGLE